MQAYHLSDLGIRRASGGDSYMEFVRSTALSAGIYHLPVGARDFQQPHTEDEVYFVTNGSAQIEVAGQSEPVLPGSIIYVPAHVDHRFHSITEDLTVLVFFAPAEGVNALPTGGYANR